MKTSQGLIKTSLALASVVAAFVATAPLASADLQADSSAPTAGTSTAPAQPRAYEAPVSQVPTPAVDAAPSAHTDRHQTGAPVRTSHEPQATRPQATATTQPHTADTPAGTHAADNKAASPQLQAPAAVNTTSVKGGANAYRSRNAIDTNDREAVRRAYIRSYAHNDVQVLQSTGADTKHCVRGHVNPIAADMVVKTWNFFRGLNNLDAVSVDPASPLSAHIQKAALAQAAQNNDGDGRGGLSHYPEVDHFKCGDSEANQAASQSNLAQANGFTPAEQIQWWFQDWSGVDQSTMNREGINDRLGHRAWLLDPYLSESAYGNVDGYNALAVVSGGHYNDYDGLRMANPNATAPDSISWPSAGFFPSELLTSIRDTGIDTGDVERWSFSARNADFSHATVHVTGPHGDVPTRVVTESMTNGPEGVSGYSTVLFKMRSSDVRPPRGNDVATYTVRISNVKDAAQSTYFYQVKVFNASKTASNVKPQLIVSREPVALQGSPAIPARIEAIGSNMHFRWQRSGDNGRTWEDVPDDTSMSTSELLGQPSTLSWSPNIKVCKNASFSGPQSCPLTYEQAKQYRFRLKATNDAGTAYTPALRAAWVGFKPLPSSVKAGTPLKATLDFEGNGDWVTTTDEVTWISQDGRTLKSDSNSPLQTASLKGKAVQARGSVWIWTRNTQSVRFVPKTQKVTIR